MNVLRNVFLYVAFALLVFGCTQPTKSDSVNSSVPSNGSLAPLSNDSRLIAAPNQTNGSNLRPDSNATGALCLISTPGQTELFLVDSTRYAYELQINGTSRVEMVNVNDSIYLHYLTPLVRGCEWISLTPNDLDSVRELGGISLLTHRQLLSRISANDCRSVPIIGRVFDVPSVVCPIKEALLRAQAGA
ncbi:hypothetical protein HY994_04305 [Candidatus Micrarchaeota archaeon]|nr:hypothetical protein [Candidatus Micrarchaeota archaeon]